MALSWDSFDTPDIAIAPSAAPTYSKPEDYYSLIDEVAGVEGVDPLVLRSMVDVESSYNPKAISSRGAQGLLQLMPGTAKEMGVVDPFDPRQNLTGGAKYLKQQLTAQGGDLSKALAAYNWGPGNLATGGELPQETLSYINKIMARSGGGDASLINDTKQPLSSDQSLSWKDTAKLGWDDFESQASPSTLSKVLGVIGDAGDVTGGTLADAVNIQDQLTPAIKESFLESATPTSPMGELPLGLGKGPSGVTGAALDVAYGVPEAAASLASGVGSFIGGQTAGLKDIPLTEEGMARAFETAEAVSKVGTYQPKTATGQLLMKPIELTFGTLLGTVDKMARATAPEGASPEALDDRSKAWQYVTNSLLLGGPLAVKGAKSIRLTPTEAKAKLTPKIVEEAKAQVMADPTTPPTVKEQVKDVTAEGLAQIIGQIDRARANAAVAKKGLVAKFPENQDIVTGLLVEAELREGKGKAQYNKVAKIVAEHPESVETLDLAATKGIGPKTKSKIEELIKQKKDLKEKLLQPIKSSIPVDRTQYSGPTVIGKTAEPSSVTPPKEPIKTSGDVDPYKTGELRPSEVNALDLPPSPPLPGHVKIGEDLYPNVKASGPTVIGELGKAPESLSPVATETPKAETKSTDVLTPSEPIELPTFDSIQIAKEEGYSFSSKRTFVTLEDAQASAEKRGPGHEVIQVGERFRVGKFTTTEIREFSTLEAVKAELEVGSEISRDQALADEGGKLGKIEFGVAKVGDKYYRTTSKIERPNELADVAQLERGEKEAAKQKAIDELFEEEGLSIEEKVILEGMEKEFGRLDGDARSGISEAVRKDKEVQSSGPAVSSAEAAKKFLEWRDSYVNLINKAKPDKKLLDKKTLNSLKTTKIIDKDGNPLTVYHGTTQPGFSEFSNKELTGSSGDTSGALGHFFTDDPSVASQYADQIGSAVYPVHLNFKNPFNMKWENFSKNFIGGDAKRIQEFKASIKKQGYDGIVIKNYNGTDTNWYIAPDSTQIVSIFNKRVPKEALPILNDEFATFKTLEDAQKFKEVSGKSGEIIQDPLTKQFMIEPELDLPMDKIDFYDEAVRDYEGESRSGRFDEEGVDYGERSSENGRNLWDLMNNERGSIDVTGLRGTMDSIEYIVRAAKKAGKTVDQWLDMLGVDPANIALFKGSLANLGQLKQEIRDKDPLGSKILMPEGKTVTQRFHRNKAGKVEWSTPPITESMANAIFNADRTKQWGKDLVRIDKKGNVRVEHTTAWFDRAMQATETKINAFHGPLKDLYRTWRDASKLAIDDALEVEKWAKSLRDQIAPERRDAVFVAAWKDMKGAEEAFKAMGIDTIEALTPQETAIVKQLKDFTRDFRLRSNYTRTHTGQKAIPKLLDLNGDENYLPMFRKLNVLKEMGVTEGMVISDNVKLGELSKTFTGMFNPHAKKRHAADIPIELDPFEAVIKYARTGFREIHISPVAALAKELANSRIPHPTKLTKKGTQARVKLSDWNPSLSNMLSRWSDSIVGKDPSATVLANSNPFIYKGQQFITKNLVVAAIGGSIRTFAVQPSSYMIQVPTLLDMRATTYGLFKLMSERPFKGDATRAHQTSSVLTIRSPELVYSEISQALQDGLFKGGQKIAADISLKPMKWMDSLVAEATWNAGYEYGQRVLKLKGEDLVHFADDAVERTQGLGIKGAVSDIQTGTYTKWLTLLQTFGINDWNFIIRDVMGVKNADVSNKQVLGRAVKYVVTTVLTGQLYKAIGYENVVPDPIGEYLKAKDEGKGDVRAVAIAAGELLEKVPIVGGSAKFGSNLGGMVGEWGDLLPEAVGKFSESLDWDKLTSRARRKNMMLIGKAIGYTMGIPFTNQIMKSINAAYNGGNPYDVIMGVYVEYKNKGGGVPSL